MKKYRKTFAIGAVTAVVTLTAGAFVAMAANPKTSPVQYSATFVCGWLPPVPPQDDQHLKPGDYATSINIHNHMDVNVSGSRRVALQYRQGAGYPPVIPFVNFSVFNRRVLEIDCVDIWAMVGVPPGTFLTGAVHIGLNQQLPVDAIYTSQTHVDPASGADPGAGHSIDVEHIQPFLNVPPG